MLLTKTEKKKSKEAKFYLTYMSKCGCYGIAWWHVETVDTTENFKITIKVNPLIPLHPCTPEG
jgi:hypothetical protein